MKGGSTGEDSSEVLRGKYEAQLSAQEAAWKSHQEALTQRVRVLEADLAKTTHGEEKAASEAMRLDYEEQLQQKEDAWRSALVAANARIRELESIIES